MKNINKIIAYGVYAPLALGFLFCTNSIFRSKLPDERIIEIIPLDLGGNEMLFQKSNACYNVHADFLKGRGYKINGENLSQLVAETDRIFETRNDSSLEMLQKELELANALFDYKIEKVRFESGDKK